MLSKGSPSHSISKENNLLKRIEKGEIDCFWDIWKAHNKYLYHYCLRQMNNNVVDAQETLSISMLKAWEKLPKYAAKITNIRGWLTRLTQNVCIDYYRKNNRSFVNSETIDILSNVDINCCFTAHNSPDKFIMGDELKTVISQEVKNLKQSLKIPLVMRFVFNKSYQDISKTLNISEPNVRKRIQKARTILKKSIKSYLLGENHLESLVTVEESFDIFSQCKLDDFLKSHHQPLSILESNLEEDFYRLYTTHLETLPSPLLMEEMAYV
ncbi:MAG: sigma-70 family RNA polymerase sigma factor [Crocosphaera sp.]|nr:sigma-70 family RNA polymerase sigma factor [Crocosphaera sp.]